MVGKCQRCGKKLRRDLLHSNPYENFQLHVERFNPLLHTLPHTTSLRQNLRIVTESTNERSQAMKTTSSKCIEHLKQKDTSQDETGNDDSQSNVSIQPQSTLDKNTDQGILVTDDVSLRQFEAVDVGTSQFQPQLNTVKDDVPIMDTISANFDTDSLAPDDVLRKRHISTVDSTTQTNIDIQAQPTLVADIMDTISVDYKVETTFSDDVNLQQFHHANDNTWANIDNQNQSTRIEDVTPLIQMISTDIEADISLQEDVLYLQQFPNVDCISQAHIDIPTQPALVEDTAQAMDAISADFEARMLKPDDVIYLPQFANSDGLATVANIDLQSQTTTVEGAIKIMEISDEDFKAVELHQQFTEASVVEQTPTNGGITSQSIKLDTEQQRVDTAARPIKTVKGLTREQQMIYNAIADIGKGHKFFTCTDAQLLYTEICQREQEAAEFKKLAAVGANTQVENIVVVNAPNPNGGGDHEDGAGGDGEHNDADDEDESSDDDEEDEDGQPRATTSTNLALMLSFIRREVANRQVLNLEVIQTVHDAIRDNNNNLEERGAGGDGLLNENGNVSISMFVEYVNGRNDGDNVEANNDNEGVNNEGRADNEVEEEEEAEPESENYNEIEEEEEAEPEPDTD